MGNLMDTREAARFESLYSSGLDHAYPNENIVRITKWYFKETGHVLDYGFGPGENLMHILKVGHQVSGIEISATALRNVGNKLKKFPEYEGKHELKLLLPENSELPWSPNTFDYIVANQVLYYLPSQERIERVLGEFKRVLKPGGKIVVSLMRRLNTAFAEGTEISPNIFEYTISKLPNSPSSRVFIVKDEVHLREMFGMFQIDELGHFDNNYCGLSGFHHVILASKES